jgi:hypothetical protein
MVRIRRRLAQSVYGILTTLGSPEKKKKALDGLLETKTSFKTQLHDAIKKPAPA